MHIFPLLIHAKQFLLVRIGASFRTDARRTAVEAAEGQTDVEVEIVI